MNNIINGRANIELLEALTNAAIFSNTGEYDDTLTYSKFVHILKHSISHYERIEDEVELKHLRNEVAKLEEELAKRYTAPTEEDFDNVVRSLRSEERIAELEAEVAKLNEELDRPVYHPFTGTGISWHKAVSGKLLKTEATLAQAFEELTRANDRTDKASAEVARLTDTLNVFMNEDTVKLTLNKMINKPV